MADEVPGGREPDGREPDGREPDGRELVVRGLVVREATTADDPAVATLAAVTADGGAVAFRLHDHVPPAARRAASAGDGGRRTVGVVAELAGVAGAVGSATVTLGRFRYEGDARPYALLGSLAVHPDHRRHGIGAALGRWRIEHARQVAGPDVVVVAEIQKGNTASFAAARRWATAFTGPALSVPVRMRSRPPRPVAGIDVRDAVADDLPAIVAGADAATADHNFSPLWTPASAAAWLAASPLDTPVHHWRVATDRSGTVVAGLALHEAGRLQSMEITHLPLAVRAANLALHVVPADRVLRNVTVVQAWFAPGHLDAAGALWEDTRWAWRERGTNLLITLDARDPLRAVLGLRPWTPTTSVVTAVRADPPPSPERLVDAVA